MKKIKKLLIAAGVILALGAVSVPALAAGTYGSSAVTAGGTYTLTEMLTYAIQDEYLASAEYAKITETFGSVRPFANIIKAEQSHIAALERLFTTYGIAIPANSAAGYVTVPASLTDALNAGVQAEKNNIAMYDKFLSQSLPDDVKAVFTALRNASESHLAAFERGLTGSAGGQARSGNGNRGSGGNSAGPNGTGICGANGTGVCTGTGTGAGTGNMNHGQGKGQLGTGVCNGACLLPA